MILNQKWFIINVVKESTLMNCRASGERMVNMADVMTDKQFKTILEMVDMILDGCKDIEEAKQKVQKLIDNQSNKEKAE